MTLAFVRKNEKTKEATKGIKRIIKSSIEVPFE